MVVFHPRADKWFLPKTVALHIDELSAIKPTAVKNLLARAGEVGVKLRIYTQSHADLVNPLGSRENAEAAIDNFGAILMFRVNNWNTCLLYTSPSPRDGLLSRMPSSA